MKVRYDTGTVVDTITGEVESGPGSSQLGAQFLAVRLPSGATEHIAIHRIYSIEELKPAPTVLRKPAPPTGKADLDSYQWVAGDPRPVGAPEVWDRNGDRWDLDEGNGLYHSEGHQFPEPWDALLEHYGPVTNRFRA
ncbi:hypothetical protein CH302_00940 [Rhodococcus sp. 15-2388-1-1a]|nr:hypothetical protein CH302_00940 [Rhodococcus sp. 15-2388-1-1a]